MYDKYDECYNLIPATGICHGKLLKCKVNYYYICMHKNKLMFLSKFNNNANKFLRLCSALNFYLNRNEVYIFIEYAQKFALYIRCSKKKSIIFPFNFMQK